MIVADVSTITANGITYDIKDVVARNKLNHAIYSVSIGSFSSFPVNVTDSNITSDMVVLNVWFSNQSALTGDVTWTTSNSSPYLKLEGTISGSTSATVVLGKISL